MRTLLFFVALMPILYSCKKESACNLSTGTEDFEIREATQIDSIRLFNDVNLVISNGHEYQIKVEAPKNLIPFIKTEFESKKLVIANENKCNFLRKNPKITVYVTVPALATIEHLGIGKISSSEPIKSSYFSLYNYAMGDTEISLLTDFIYVHSTSGGVVKLKGKSKVFKIYSTGTGFLYGEEFISKTAEITSKTTGDILIYVEEELKINLIGKGSVYYKGEPPKVDTLRSGDGTIVRLL